MQKPKRRRVQRHHIANIGYGKTVASAVGGAVAIIVAWIVQDLLHYPLRAEVIPAFQTILTTAAVFFTHHTLTEGR
jgi:hypothetical protein